MGPDGISELCEDVAQGPVFPSLHLWPPARLPKTISQRKKTLRPGLWIILHNVQAPPRSEQWQYYSPCRDIPGGQW